MKQLEEKHYQSDENKIIVRLSDSYRMGTDMYLAEVDSIENYTEEDMTEDEIKHYSKLKEEEKIPEKHSKKHH